MRVMIFLLLMVSALVVPHAAFASHTPHIFPKRANYFLHWQLNETTARELSKWDMVILDMETQMNSRPLLEKMREWNPRIQLIVYITSEEILRTAPIGDSRLRQKLAARIDPRWYATDSNGTRLAFWPGTDLLNMSVDAPTIDGKKMNKVMAEFVANELLATGLWNGVFYDNTFDSVTWFAGPNVDFNRDGRPDADPDASWRAGMKFLYDETRRLTGNRYVILGNGTTRTYRDTLNGQMIENFIPSAWTPTMQTYAYLHDGGPAPRMNIINANTANRGDKTDYRAMRFGLTSALLSDGYFSFDHGDQNHGQTWYYDEYTVDLGRGNGPPVPSNGGKHFSPDVWRRDFDHGIAVVNSSPAPQTVSLQGEYERIRGTEDPRANDGRIVSEMMLDPHDGRILLKTFATLDDVVFTNGHFVRFLRPTGEKVRNGFFVFEDGYAGGTEVAHIDLDGNGKRDLMVALGNKLSLWRDDGQLFLRVYPYGVSYRGELRIAVGDVNGDGEAEIIVAPSDGYPAPIKIYSRHGERLGSDWFPLGEGYRGGYSVAIGNVSGGEANEVVIGAGKGTAPRVSVYGVDSVYNRTRLFEWLAFERTFLGGVNVAVGNLDGTGREEIIVGAGLGKPPIIRTFNVDGTPFAKEFKAYDALGTPGIDVRSADVDFDGKEDIIGVSAEVGI